MLFNGRDLSNWRTRDGKPAGWQVEDGVMTVVPGTRDIVSQERFQDFQLHVEFRIPDMPEMKGQGKGNSGVYLQGRYEIQVLDSYGINIPGKGDCGAIYDIHAPLVNACRPAMVWQTYDVFFRAPRFDEAGNIQEHVRVTVLQNGVTIHNNIVIPKLTGGPLDQNVHEPGPLLLQDHGHLVSYRNVWVIGLPLEGSPTYEPR
jgi:hypothetical protein